MATTATTDNGDNGNKDYGNGWRNDDRWHDNNTTAMAAMSGATANNW
jgi:hypothetical protein